MSLLTSASAAVLDEVMNRKSSMRRSSTEGSRGSTLAAPFLMVPCLSPLSTAGSGPAVCSVTGLSEKSALVHCPQQAAALQSAVSQA